MALASVVQRKVSIMIYCQIRHNKIFKKCLYFNNTVTHFLDDHSRTDYDIDSWAESRRYSEGGVDVSDIWRN